MRRDTTGITPSDGRLMNGSRGHSKTPAKATLADVLSDAGRWPDLWQIVQLCPPDGLTLLPPSCAWAIASVFWSGLGCGCRMSPPGQALTYLFNGGLGWLPGLRPGVAQLSIALGEPVGIRRFSAFFHLSLDKTYREDEHGQQRRER